MTKEQIETFLQAGHAIFTLKSKKTGKHFTYKIKRGGGPEGPGPLFVSLLIGDLKWMYVGLYRPGKALHLTAKSHFSPDAPSVRALSWFLQHVDSPLVEFKHAGKCGRCGRVLTHPDSIDSGLGPECSGRALAAFHGPAKAKLQHLPPMPKSNFERQAESAKAAEPLLRAAIERANPGGTWLQDQYLTVPVERVDCSAAIDNAVAKFHR
jgi:hypothetical protein